MGKICPMALVQKKVQNQLEINHRPSEGKTG